MIYQINTMLKIKKVINKHKLNKRNNNLSKKVAK